jgi:predicted DNA binding CopG/RHH family protein
MRDKRSKFIELANNRVNRAIKDLRLIGNLSNRAAYEYKDEDVRQIVRALQQELEAVRARFGRSGEKSESEFQLKP